MIKLYGQELILHKAFIGNLFQVFKEEEGERSKKALHIISMITKHEKGVKALKEYKDELISATAFKI